MEFKPENSYTRNYTKRYEDSAKVADRCMTRYVREYFSLRKRVPVFGEFRDMVLNSPTGFAQNPIQQSILDHLADLYAGDEMDNYPYEKGFYNDSIIRAMKATQLQQSVASYEPVFDLQMRNFYNNLI